MKNRALEDSNVLGVESDYDELLSGIKYLRLLQDVKEVRLRWIGVTSKVCLRSKWWHAGIISFATAS